jgi:hypothetical protein
MFNFLEKGPQIISSIIVEFKCNISTVKLDIVSMYFSIFGKLNISNLVSYVRFTKIATRD